jgi:hypothetical protein
MNPYVFGYGVSLVVGAIVLWPAWRLLHHLTSRIPRTPDDKEATTIWWIPVSIGVVERMVFTTLIAWNVSGAASFIGAWVTIKAVGGWNTWNKGSTYGRATFMIALILSALSAMFGIFGGISISTYLAGLRP